MVEVLAEVETKEDVKAAIDKARSLRWRPLTLQNSPVFLWKFIFQALIVYHGLQELTHDAKAASV